MAAMGELLDKIWDRVGIQSCELLRESDETYCKGQIFRHNVKKCTKSKTNVKVKVNFTIYVDDKALPFVSRSQLCKGLPLVQALFKRLGIEMHIGTHVQETNIDGESVEKMLDSKTECVFFPLQGTLSS